MMADLRKSRVETLLAGRQRQQSMMGALTNLNKSATLAGVKIIYLLNRRGMLYIVSLTKLILLLDEKSNIAWNNKY